MPKVTTTGLDIATSVFHACGADEQGAMLHSKMLSRGKLLEFFAEKPWCMIALEARRRAHPWARRLQEDGLSRTADPAGLGEPFAKRHKNYAMDAEWICEAKQQPGMRFVAMKTEAQRAARLVFRTRYLAVRQRIQLTNAIRGHLAEYGWVTPRGKASMTMLADLLEEEEFASSLPGAAVPMIRLMVDMLAKLHERTATLDHEIVRRAREDEPALRLETIPALANRRGSDRRAGTAGGDLPQEPRLLAAWLGLAPRQHSTGANSGSAASRR